MTSSRTRQHRGTVVAAGVTTLVVAGAMLVTVADQGVAVTAQVAHGGKDPTLSPRLAALAALAASSAPGASAQRLNSLGLASEGPGSLIRSGRNSVLVDIRAAGSTSAVVREVAAVGGSVVHVAEQYGVVTASIPVEAAPVVAHSGVALHVSEEVTPVTGSGAAASAVPGAGCVPRLRA